MSQVHPNPPPKKKGRSNNGRQVKPITMGDSINPNTLRNNRNKDIIEGFLLTYCSGIRALVDDFHCMSKLGLGYRVAEVRAEWEREMKAGVKPEDRLWKWRTEFDKFVPAPGADEELRMGGKRVRAAELVRMEREAQGEVVENDKVDKKNNVEDMEVDGDGYGKHNANNNDNDKGQGYSNNLYDTVNTSSNYTNSYVQTHSANINGGVQGHNSQINHQVQGHSNFINGFQSHTNNLANGAQFYNNNIINNNGYGYGYGYGNGMGMGNGNFANYYYYPNNTNATINPNILYNPNFAFQLPQPLPTLPTPCPITPAPSRAYAPPPPPPTQPRLPEVPKCRATIKAMRNQFVTYAQLIKYLLVAGPSATVAPAYLGTIQRGIGSWPCFPFIKDYMAELMKIEVELEIAEKEDPMDKEDRDALMVEYGLFSKALRKALETGFAWAEGVQVEKEVKSLVQDAFQFYIS